MLIPKTLYMYWHDGRPPPIVRRMVNLAKRKNPSWRVRVLTEKSKCEKPRGFEELQVQHQSDWYRIYYLAKHGGVWMDISCIHLHPLEMWVDMKSAALQGFQWPFRTKTMENWAFAAPANNAFVREWKEEFKGAIEMGFRVYQRRYDKSLLGTSPEDYDLPYLTQHAAWRAIRNRFPESRHPEFAVRLRSAVNFHTGPYGILHAADYDADVFMRRLLKAGKKRFARMPFVKLRGGEREALEEAVDARDSTRACGYILALLRECSPK